MLIVVGPSTESFHLRHALTWRKVKPLTCNLGEAVRFLRHAIDLDAALTSQESTAT